MANTQGMRGDNRTQSRWQGKKIWKGTSTVSGKKPSQGFSHQYFCSTCNNRNASKVEDITEWAPYLVTTAILNSLKTTWWRDRKGKQKEGAIWQKKYSSKEISSTSQRKPVSEAGVWDQGSALTWTVPWHKRSWLSLSVLQQWGSRKLEQAEEKSSPGFAQKCLHPESKESENFLSF